MIPIFLYFIFIVKAENLVFLKNIRRQGDIQIAELAFREPINVIKFGLYTNKDTKNQNGWVLQKDLTNYFLKNYYSGLETMEIVLQKSLPNKISYAFLLKDRKRGDNFTKPFFRNKTGIFSLEDTENYEENEKPDKTNSDEDDFKKNIIIGIIIIGVFLFIVIVLLICKCLA
ncbi:hypothetical protein CWI38_0964p0010 [Hamiltosporidium tvaerminnensis]|uniref:Uncharacterized protein n=1 Tax=Hamiltosporidium tvaerminnensis TaxID=1176355 RepID=A0A4Q9LW76_9MICR|nr:hypothetical protein CWI38_0964p0010 [Hamiltosporidium tvaerminnensis]